VFDDPIDPKSYNPSFVPPLSFRYMDEQWKRGK